MLKSIYVKVASIALVHVGPPTLGVMLSWGPSSIAQMSAEEHASHHPGLTKGQGAQEPKKAMGDGAAKPEAAPGPETAMGGGMGDMMKGMGTPPPMEIYPTLMALPGLSPEKRDEIARRGGERMTAGAARLSGAVDRLSEATLADDYAAMQEATAQMREGLSLFESGLAARRVVAEGKPPHQVAQQWFKGEMDLQPPIGVEARGALLDVTPFHLFTMVLLVAFAAAMLAMYVFKMRRAAALFGRIEGDAGTPPPGSASPLSGAPGPAPPAAPAVEPAVPAPPTAGVRSPRAGNGHKAAATP